LIPNEVGAAPYHNWNERIHAECYVPNAKLGNFEHISFNIGPTLFEWMAEYDPQTTAKIIEQDKNNVQHFGVGNAIAQSYNHTILPLASHADKVTQIEWGIAEFVHRFGRYPQGMWLPETAADLETLSVLAEHDIQFTILAPWQADSDHLDSTHPYQVRLPEGRSINVFFFDQELSSRISFDPSATINADTFVRQHVSPRFRSDKIEQGEPQLILIASDGELYGHHQKFRDRFLARLGNGAMDHEEIDCMYPALWLKKYPPRQWSDIQEKTSWSCHHGVMRWMGECDCTPGDGRWKYYLRHAFDHLAVSLDQIYKEALTPYIPDPWGLRNQYIQVMLKECTAAQLINDLAGRILPVEVVSRIHLLLEAQRERQRTFTSCGWFFDDFSRIEPKNNVAYAAQVIRLTRMATGFDLAPQVLSDLKRVVSHRTGLRGDMVLMRHLRRVTGEEIR
jgi:alpha-amylase/alpha-mannosidase (GH57 family)